MTQTTIDQPTTVPSGAPGVRRARAADREATARALAAAFQDDPVFVWLVPEDDVRRRLLVPLFLTFGDAYARHDETYVVPTPSGAGEAAGAALWVPPGVEPVDPEDTVFVERITALAAPWAERFGIIGEAFAAAHPHDPVWYLHFLGVAPGHQGGGHGSRMMREVLDRADAAGDAAYLEATSERNRRLYERHGFRVVGEVVLPDGPTAFAMRRDPA